MSKKFKMSMMGELNFFLGLQVKQLSKGIFASQRKYDVVMLKRFLSCKDPNVNFYEVLH